MGHQLNEITIYGITLLFRPCRLCERRQDPPASPQATANVLIEINDAALASGRKERHLDLSSLSEPQRVELAAEIAKDAASDYLRSEEEFRRFPVQTFVDFNLAGTPTYISIRPPAAKTLPNHAKVWRLAECDSDQLRTKPLPVLCGITKSQNTP
jgi:hypothetical protein